MPPVGRARRPSMSSDPRVLLLASKCHRGTRLILTCLSCRCARNCFLCPHCTNTLVVVASDPPPDLPPTSQAASVGEPPYYLACNFCKWDSKEINLAFEKPTGLSCTPELNSPWSFDGAGLINRHFSQCRSRGRLILLRCSSLSTASKITSSLSFAPACRILNHNRMRHKRPWLPRPVRNPCRLAMDPSLAWLPARGRVRYRQPRMIWSLTEVRICRGTRLKTRNAVCRLCGR
jgi:Dynactin p62 family